jgi:hypothetical protein
VVTTTAPVERRLPLWEEPAMFALSRLKEAAVRNSERRFEVGEVIYTRKEMRSAVRVRSSALRMAPLAVSTQCSFTELLRSSRTSQ